MRSRSLLTILLLLVPVLTAANAPAAELSMSDPVQVTALAVAQRPSGELVGVNATVSVSVGNGGSGHVFIDTRPLAGTDMQGSARIAARVASGLSGHSLSANDLFFVVRSQSPIIAGPSAGAVMTLAAVVALENANLAPGEQPWALDPGVMATGTITPDGSIGPVGGILHKAQAAAEEGAHTFLVPEGQGNYTPRVPGSFGEGPVDVAQYCQEELNITCKEVGRIEDLVAIATGRRYEAPPLGEPPTTARYADTLGPATEPLVAEATNAHAATWQRLNESGAEPRARETVQARLDAASEPLQQAQRAWDEGRYYLAASLSFQASIEVQRGSLLLDFLENGRSLDHLEDAVETVRQDVRTARAAVDNATVEGLQDLYTVGAAQQRVVEAAQRLSMGREALNATDVQTAVAHLAFTIERTETVHWWLSLSEPFDSGPALEAPVATVAQEFLDLGNEMLAYGSSVMGSGALGNAGAALERAKAADERGYHAAAVLEAAQAQVLATIPLELQAGTPTEDKVAASQDAAVRAIQRARGLGLEPLLPIAMFEFAKGQQDPAAQLQLLRTSRVLAGVANSFAGDAEPRDSRFVHQGQADGQTPSDPAPVEDHGTRAEPNSHADGDPAPVEGPVRTLAVGYFVVGFVTALVLVAMVAAIRR